MFRVPSSSPPSTPGSFRPPQFARNAPSTTPAGLPPPEPALFPANNNHTNMPNPLSFDRPLYGSSPPKRGYFEGFGSAAIGTSTTGRPTSGMRSRPTSGAFTAGFPMNSPDAKAPSRHVHDMDHDQDVGDDDEGDYMDDDEYDDEDGDGEYDDDDEYNAQLLAAQRRAKTQHRPSQSVISRTSTTDLDQGPTLVRSGAKQTHFDLLALAKGLTSSHQRPALHEPAHVVLETERLADRVHASLLSDTPEQRAHVLSDVARELVPLWSASSKSASSSTTADLSSASRLASLLLSIHHPSPTQPSHPSSALSLVPARPESRQYTPVPKLLLDWLNNTYSAVSEVEQVLKSPRGYSSHPSFWEAVQASAVRGNFAQTLQLLQGANLQVADTAQHDGLGDDGYTGSHLRYANDAVRAAILLLRECPAVASDDWDVKGHDWTLFRQRVNNVYFDLQEFAEGDSASRHSISQPFQASHFGISQSQASFHLSVASRKAESRVPWSIYEELRRLYQLLLGNEEEILAISADWIEAVLGLTIWWNGEEDYVPQGSLAASRRSLMRSQRVRPVDVTPVKAYCQRMSSALAAVVKNSDEEFSVNVTDPFEVGLACVLDDNVEGVLQILRGWSLMAAATVAEIASAGEWYVRAGGIMGQFDQSDLMVLSYNEQQPKGVTKDNLQIAYSELLSTQGTIAAQDARNSREGWELAIQVLGRLDDGIAASERIERILNDLSLESATRVDKITQLCHDMGLATQALGVALKYADHLRANTQNYGDTLLYYARAHSASKIQEVLRVLVAHCLVKSIAYPPLDELDESLNSLITSPKPTLTKLANLDPEAASILSNNLSGYATIRKFYDLRDQEVLSKQGEKPAHRPMARKRAAANALMVIISSAASSIQGGLYDPEIETVVQVDVLLPLLGEALVFINQPKRTLTLRHLYDLLAAVEDFETASSLIHGQCEEVLSTTLSAAHDTSSSPPNPHHLLQKSTSGLTTASSQYSLIGSTEFGSVQGQSIESSAVLIKGGHVDESRRGWDWRKGFQTGAHGEDITRLLRLGIAKEIGRAFAEGEVTA